MKNPAFLLLVCMLAAGPASGTVIYSFDGMGTDFVNPNPFPIAFTLTLAEPIVGTTPYIEWTHADGYLNCTVWCTKVSFENWGGDETFNPYSATAQMALPFQFSQGTVGTNGTYRDFNNQATLTVSGIEDAGGGVPEPSAALLVLAPPAAILLLRRRRARF